MRRVWVPVKFYLLGPFDAFGLPSFILPPRISFARDVIDFRRSPGENVLPISPRVMVLV